MADLAEALDTALRDRYPSAEPKTPATQRRGLMARMNHLEKLFTRKADAAKAAGISPRTWREWRAGTSKPSARNLRKLEAAHARLVAIPKFRKTLRARPVPAAVKVTATIAWSKSPKKRYNAQPHRTTTLTGMRAVMAAVIRTWATVGPEAAADALERGAAQVYGAEEIQFQGDEVEIEFP